LNSKKQNNSGKDTLQEVNFDAADLMGELDKQISGQGTGKVKVTEPAKKEAKAEKKTDEKKGGEDHDWQKRYEDSTGEARKLKEERDNLYHKNKETEPYLPILQALQNDDGLVDIVMDYVKGGKQPQQSSLKLPEDFVYDPEEAIKDPNSMSARVDKQRMLDVLKGPLDEIKNELRGAIASGKKETSMTLERENFMRQKGYSEEEMQSLERYGSNKKLSLEDINDLYLRDNPERKAELEKDQRIANDKIRDAKLQAERARAYPESLSGEKAAEHQVPVEDVIFNTIQKLRNDQNLMDRLKPVE